MKKNKREHRYIPDAEEVEAELSRLRKKKKYNEALRGTLYTLLIVSALSTLLSMLFIPVLQVTGTSMEPTLMDGDIVLISRIYQFETGDLCSFYYNNKLLLKRVIGLPGDVIVIDGEGTVFINGQELFEPYLKGKALGESNIEYPYQVPESTFFVLGDDRLTSIDSRNTAVGCINKDQIVGRVVLRLGTIKGISEKLK